MPTPSPRQPYSPGEWRKPKARPPAAIAKTRRNRHRIRRLFGALVALGIAGTLMGGLALALLLAWSARDLPDPARLITRTVPQSTKIYDRTGTKLLYEIHGEERRTHVTLDQIAPTVKWATIAVEDRTFYQHRGISFRGILRATWVNLRGGSLQGGSTITQQLIKNAILTPDRIVSRKLKELLVAYQMERRFSKDEILTLYLNEIPYGSTAYGVEAASQTFFGKSARDVDLAESAMLAALPNGPTYYSPYGSHRDALVARTHAILSRMAEQGYISQEDAATATQVDILKRVRPRREAIVAPHFVMYVRELLTNQYGERVVEQGGLKVTTSIDLDLQSAAEAAVTKYGDRNAKEFNSSNAALVAIDPRTGQILAMVGSRDFFDPKIDGQVNVALRPRQPGSSFKPIVYAAAFAKGYTPDTLIADTQTTFPTTVGAYQPHNYNGKEYGFVTLRKALAGSLNIPAVKTLYLTGIDTAIDLAERLGYTTLRDRARFGLALVLGGGEVTLLEHTSAYATLAADGIRRPTVAILRVEDQHRQVLTEAPPDSGTRVVDAEVVRQLTSVMTDNDARTYVFGPRSPLAFPNRLVAAKTGTTNDWRDAWTMGFTPSLAVGVWVGNNNNAPMKHRSDGSFVAAPIWRMFLDTSLTGKPAESFTAPQPIPDLPPILHGVHPGTVRVRIDRTTGKRATDATPPDQVEEREYQDLHDILHYVRRDDPRGAPPDRPEDDPMYAAWEAGVRSWAKRNHLTLSTPPAEMDDVHTEANRPALAITTPEPRAYVSGREVLVAGSVAAPRGVQRITITIDHIAAALFAPTAPEFQYTVRLPASIGRGLHDLRVSAYDDVGNERTVVVPIDVLSDREPIALIWEQPNPGATLRTSDFPATLTIRATTTAGANRVEILMASEGSTELLTSVVPPPDGIIRVLWPQRPTPGPITLRARLYADTALLAESDPREVTVE
ncbi:PBP1A family penicillin-binding protein [Candidatus Uhrbacteria bacterium]|nr:PBP1A family penicillin-binding protein [Candidatus Uhrbacteria bacterium]